MENAQYASVECKDLAWRTHLLRSIRVHKDIKEAYRLTAPGVMVERRVHRSRKKEGGYAYKRREGNSHHSISRRSKVVILCLMVLHTYICHQPNSLQLMDVCSGRCDHAGG